MARPFALRLYNTLTRQVEPVVPKTPGRVTLYCCGPTTYDVSHAGHGRSTGVLPDLLVRHLRASGVEVTYARNITDVEDKIVKRSRERGEEPLALSAHYATLYQEDIATLGCLEPTHEPRVSETMPEIIAHIEGLIARGAAYRVATPCGDDVWYSVRAFESYGKLSRRSLDDLRTGEGLEERGKVTKEGKRDPLDFALWKSVAEGDWGFDSPFGKGRPGWHIECSAMVEKYLGYGIDIHAGGMDLIFPHHENEIAQSEALHAGEGPFAHIWIHGGFLTVDKEKMAKSLGNFVTMRDCYARNDPEALRFFLLSAHYRGPVEFDTNMLEDGRVVFPGLDEAERRVDYLYSTVERLTLAASEGAPPAPAKPLADLRAIEALVAGARDRVADSLDDDLNAPVAIAVVLELAEASNRLCDLIVKRKKDAAFGSAAADLAGRALAALRACTDVLGLMQANPLDYASRTQTRRLALRGLATSDIDAKVAARTAARAAKDFALGDALRAELAAMDVEIADGPQGTTWRVCV
jgi:cysteinyl-tRNA synthetase